MRIGDSILSRITETVNIIEKQFNAVEMIDNYDLEKKDLFELLKAITKILRSISDCEISHLFMNMNSVPELCFTYPTQAGSDKIKFESIELDKKSLIVINEKKEQRSLLILPINSKYIPECYIILKEAFYGRKNFKIHDKEFQTYLIYIAEKIVEKIEHYSESKMLVNHRELSQRFLLSYQKSDTNLENENGQENIWTNILKSTFDYLPQWGPLLLRRNDTRIQLLKVHKGRRFLNLLAESEEKNGEWVIGIRNLNLDRNWTICGIYLDNEEKGVADKYLLVNPKEYKDRYASILFANEEIPESELIIPIKDSNGKTVVIFNFEHISKKSFSKFHIAVLMKMVQDVKPFVNYAIYKNEQQIDMEKKLRYLMLRIATKLTSTQQHKLKGDFGILMTAIHEIKEGLTIGNNNLVLEEIENAKQTVSAIRQTSLDFTVNLKDYIQYGKKLIFDILIKSLPDAQKKAKLNGDNIVIKTVEIPKDKYVFCSGIVQEHIYNVLQNSIDQFISIRKKNDQNFVGEIHIDYGEINRSDIIANIYTENFIEVSISDNGGGIPPESEEWIFGFGNSLKKEDGGNGFGLYAAREYMREIGGDLLLVNNYPIGATFKMQFPEYYEALHDALSEQLNIKGGK